MAVDQDVIEEVFNPLNTRIDAVVSTLEALSVKLDAVAAVPPVAPLNNDRFFTVTAKLYSALVAAPDDMQFLAQLETWLDARLGN